MSRLSQHPYNYRITDFVCEVIICAHYVSRHRLANFNFAVSYSCIFVSAHCTCHSSVLVISLSYVSVQILQKSGNFCLSCLTQQAKGLWWLCASHCSISPNILVDMVSSDHRVYSNNNSTSQAIACDDFTRSHNLVIVLLCRYNNHRYYCWTEKLMLYRN